MAAVRRCHQYHPVLASIEGQQLLQRVLESWLQSHPECSYWQGMDSLAAPFVVVHFHRATKWILPGEPGMGAGQEKQNRANSDLLNYNTSSQQQQRPDMPTGHDSAHKAALECFDAWARLHLDGMYAAGGGGTSLLRQQLAELTRLLEKQLPALATHFEAEKVTPDLYAIPWILTVFSHVLPISSTMQLWDALLVVGSHRGAHGNINLYVAVGILRQFARELQRRNFDEILMLLSRPPSIDVDAAVGWAKNLVVEYTR